MGLGGRGVDGEGQHAGCFVRLQFGPRGVCVFKEGPPVRRPNREPGRGCGSDAKRILRGQFDLENGRNLKSRAGVEGKFVHVDPVGGRGPDAVSRPAALFGIPDPDEVIHQGVGMREGIAGPEAPAVPVDDVTLDRGDLKNDGQVGGGEAGGFRQKERLSCIPASGVNGGAAGKRDVVVGAFDLIQGLDNRVGARSAADAERDRSAGVAGKTATG